MNKKILFLIISFFCVIVVFSQISLQEHIVIDDINEFPKPSMISTADLNGDNNLDVIVASNYKIGWYENIDGQGNFGIPRIIKTFELQGKKTIFTIDVDNDGDIDIFVSSAPNNAVYLLKNIDGQGNFNTIQIAWNTQWIQAIHGADIDNDGDIDLLSGFGSKIVLHKNLGNGGYGSHQIITSNVSGINEIFSADIDNDGDIDILSASINNHKIAWYENLDGQGNFSSQQIISSNAFYAKSVYASDIDGDGDIDILSASSGVNKLVWYENLDGQGNFSDDKIISNEVGGARLISAKDIDNDGDMDVVSGSYYNENSKLAWYENLDGQGNFGIQHIISTQVPNINSIHISDINNDGFYDVFSSSLGDNKISWNKNLDGQGNFGIQQAISKGAMYPTNIFTTDLDGDNDLDIISTSELDRKLAWYDNVDGQGNFIQNIISIDVRNISDLISFDIDNDIDDDIVLASTINNDLVWYENDGNGSFNEKQFISTNTNNIKSIISADLDGDNNLDIISTSESNNKIFWYKNLNNQGEFTLKEITTTSNIKTIITSDVDNDNDNDIIAINDDFNIVWYKNTDGLGNFNVQQIIPNINARIIFTVDYDYDGDLDIISIIGIGNRQLVWFENIDGQGNFGTYQVLISNNFLFPYSTNFDFDNDGDIDIISASLGLGSSKLRFFENVIENGNFELVQTKSYYGRLLKPIVGDINGDGNMDIIYAANTPGVLSKIAWLENTRPLSINENTSSSFSIYPNPTNSILTIKSSTTISQIAVYNKMGQLVLINTDKNTIDVSSLTQNLYFIKIKDKNGNYESKKMIKK